MEDGARLATWAAVVVGSISLVFVYMLRTPNESLGIRATHSMAERYGLFIIIVLGEVVVGVVDGLGEVEDLDFPTVATGVLGLTIAFGFWWTYFDYVGRRLPRQNAGSLVLWLYSHLPIALAVAAAGAGMVSLIEHAADPRTPQPSSWLLAGSVSGLLVALVATIVSLADYRRLPALYRPLAFALTLVRCGGRACDGDAASALAARDPARLDPDRDLVVRVRPSPADAGRARTRLGQPPAVATHGRSWNIAARYSGSRSNVIPWRAASAAPQA